MPREAINEIILAAVCFVGNDDDIAAIRQQRMLIFIFSGKEFLHCGKNHAAGARYNTPQKLDR